MAMLRTTTSRAAIHVVAILPVILVSASVTSVGQLRADSAPVEVTATSDKASGDSGISGQVSIRPVRPHETIGVPNLAPYQAKLEVLDPSGRSVTSFETDPSGYFRIVLPPGNYVLRPQSSGPYPRASEQTVVVSPKSFAQVKVIYNSGIR